MMGGPVPVIVLSIDGIMPAMMSVAALSMMAPVVTLLLLMMMRGESHAEFRKTS